MSFPETIRADVERLQKQALLAGAAALAVSLLGALASPENFFRAYLVGFLFWAGLALGCFALLMLHHLTGGGWGFVIRRLLEAGTRTFPVLLALFLPIAAAVWMDSRAPAAAAGEHPHVYLYEWAHGDVVARDKILTAKEPYLNINFFLLRSAAYFLIWMGIAWKLNQLSAEQDRTADQAIPRRLQTISGPGLILYGLTVTFASVDWAMSIEPHWFSTVYGLMFIIGQALTTLSFAVIVLMRLRQHAPMAGVVKSSHFHDLGNMMLAFVMLWAYIAFSQFLIIWSGNLPEENVWYLRRMGPGWGLFAALLFAFHFALPFLLLLSRRTKQSARTLARVGLWMLVVRLCDLLWLITPAFDHMGAYWLYVAAPIGIGGIWLWGYLAELQKQPLLPLGDTQMNEALAHATEH